MSKVLIYEKLSNVTGFKKVRSDDGFIRLSGVFAQSGVKNRNNRTYTTENYSKMIEDLKKRIVEEGCPGELEHPTTMNIDYNNVSHMVESVEIDQNGTVTGTIKLLDTPKGKIAQALVEGGLPLFISSRATGNVDKNGIVTLEELKTYDLVGTPGFAQARLHCNEGMVAESIDDDMFIVYENDNDNQNKTENTMEIEALQDELKNTRALLEDMTNKYKEVLETVRDLRENNKQFDIAISDLKKTDESLTESDIRTMIEEAVNKASDSIIEKLSEGIEKWIVEEYSPEIEKWIVEEYSPEVENWLNEEFAPDTLGNMLKENKESKLANIDAILEMLDTEKAPSKPVVENNTEEPYFIAAMPENIRPLWESASDDMKSHIIAKAGMFTLNTDEKIRYFWENKVDFKKEIQPAKSINEGLDTITNQFEKNLRMALRRQH